MDSMVAERVLIWDNSRQPDWKCAGRYMAELHADTEFVYWQDDDVLVPPETQRRLIAEASPDYVVANWGHGENPDGYDDLPLVGAGAVAPRGMAWRSIARYAERYPLDEDFKYEADFVVGVLYEDFRHLHLPFEIDYEAAQAPERLCNQEWQRDLKLEITNRARSIRDEVLAAA